MIVSWHNIGFLSPFNSWLICHFYAQGLPLRGSSEPGTRWKKNWMRDHQKWTIEMFDADSMNCRKEIRIANGLATQYRSSILGEQPKVVNIAITVHRIHGLHLSLSHLKSHPPTMPIHKVGSGFVQWSPNSCEFTAGPVQTEPGGNGGSGSTSESYFPVPTVPQPSDAFAMNLEEFHLAGYMDSSSLTGPVHPSESTQGLRHGPRQE